MEEVDSILIYTLKQIGCDVGSKIEDLSPSQIIKCVSRCFELIRPDLSIPMYEGNTSMSARYKVASQISQAIIDLGYKEEVGCQTFLYPTANETRKLLIFMMEKLPKSLDNEVDNNIETLMSRVSEQKEASNNNEVHVSNGVLMGGIRLPAAVDVDSLPKETLRFYASHLADLAFAKEKAKFKVSENTIQIPQPQEVPKVPTIEDDDDDFGDPDEPIETEEVDIEPRPPSPKVIEKPLIAEKPKIVKPKPKPPVKQKPNLSHSKSKEDEGKKAEEERIAAEAAEKMKLLLEDANEKTFQLNSKEYKLNTLCQSISSVEEDILKVREELNEREKELSRKKKAAQLLTSEDGLEKLKRAVESQIEKIMNLAQQWEKHRKPLIQQILAKNKPENQSAAWKQKEEIKSMKRTLKEMGCEAKSKEEQYTALLAEYEKMPKDLTRSSYTKRILEIVGNIKKQRKEITKVLNDTKEIQKDINSLSGKLGRTFAVADELIYQDAEKDRNIAPSYKLLVAIHSDFSCIIKSLEEIGNHKRSSREYEDKLDLEKAKNVEGTLERLRADIAQMKHENQVLQAKLRDPAFRKDFVSEQCEDGT